MSLSMSLSAAPVSAFSMATLQTSLFESHIIEVLALFFGLLVVHLFQPMFMAMLKVLLPAKPSGAIKGHKTMCEDDLNGSYEDDSLSTSADDSAVGEGPEPQAESDVISIASLLSLRPKVGPAPDSALRVQHAVPLEGFLAKRSGCRKGAGQPSRTLRQKPSPLMEVAPRLSKLGPLLEVDAVEEEAAVGCTQLQKEVALGRRMSQLFRQEAVVFRETREAFQEALDELEAEETSRCSQMSTRTPDVFQGLVFCETARAIHDALEALGGPM